MCLLIFKNRNKGFCHSKNVEATVTSGIRVEDVTETSDANIN